jgi:peptidyl-prolyl cis-trans isomerase A (cyclophilin A)
MNRRTLVVLFCLFAAPALAQVPAETTPPAPAPTPAPSPFGRTVRVDLTTDHGLIVLELYPDRAPITVANFLRYVKTKRYDGVDIYRAARAPGAPTFGFIQGGVQNDPKRVLPPIAHEPTTQTGILHKDGTITMARLAPGTATSDFVITVGDAPYLDANPAATGDNLGFAAFGRVVQGMDVVKAILALPTGGHARSAAMRGEILDPPVKIVSMKVETPA